MATLATGKLSELFEDFLKTTQDKGGNYTYRSKISDLVATEGKSISVDFEDLLRYNGDLANKVLLEPDAAIDAFKRAAYETMRSENALYADRIRKVLTVRIRNIPDRIPLRKVDTSFLDKMLAVSGMIVRTSELRPLLEEGAFVCTNGHVTMQVQDDQIMKRPLKCETCDEGRNLELDNRLSRFIDYQILRVQELPEELPPGHLPQFFDVNAEGDIVNTARPGDRVVLTGVMRAVPEYAQGQGRMRVFKSQIDCNFIEVIGKEPESVQVTKDEEELIKSIAASPDAYQKLVNSIAPAILGHLPEKEAILLLLAGGIGKALPDGTKLRGDINVLLVGDPGVAKSEMLKFAAQVSPRGLFASGKGTTAAGLSAAVIREKNVFLLEAGVVVLADLGIACLHPESRMILNGRAVEIGELAKRVKFMPIAGRDGVEETAELSGKVPSIDDSDLSLSIGEVTRLRRKWFSGDLCRITLRSGHVVRVTPDHLLLDGNTIEWKNASRFGLGDYLVSPLRIPHLGLSSTLYIWDVLPETVVVSLTPAEKLELRNGLEAKHGSLREAARAIRIPRLPSYYSGRLQPSLGELLTITRSLRVEDSWRRRSHVYDRSRLLVTEVTPGLAYICGFIFGDGHVKISKRRATIVVTQSPKHQAYIRRFKEFWSTTFGELSFRKPRLSIANIRGIEVRSERIDWSVSRRVLGDIYAAITRDDLDHLPSLPTDVLAGFLAGVTDSDGCFTEKSTTKGGRSYETWNLVWTATSSVKANLNLLLALRRFGCIGSFRGIRGRVGIITVSGRSDCIAIQRALAPYSVKMRTPPAERITNISGASEKLPREPVARVFNQIFGNAPRSDLIKDGLWSTVYEYSHSKRQPSIGQVMRVMTKTQSLGPRDVAELQKLIQKDYFLDEIVHVEKEAYEGFVYDPMMREVHNFVVDGVFSHNCIDEFDKMREEDRSALHEQMEQQSYHPSTEILLADGSKVKIGDLVNGQFTSSDDRIEGVNCEILPVRGISVYAVGPDHKIVEQQVNRVSRHKAPQTFFVVRYSNGRELTVTPEHPVYVFRDGKISTIPASAVRRGDFVPAPLSLPTSTLEPELVEVEASGRKSVLQVLSLSPSLSRILGYLVTEGNFYQGSSAEVDFTNLNPVLLQDMSRLMEKTFGMTPTLRLVDGSPSGLRYVSKTLLDWFRANFPDMTRKARLKRAPRQVFNSSTVSTREFLASAFLGDGSLESEGICYRTSSRLLAEDYQDLLSKLGVASRIAVDRSNNSFKTYVAGHSLGTFFEKIVEDMDPRKGAIERLVQRSQATNRNHDVMPAEVAKAIVRLLRGLGIPYDGRYWSTLGRNNGITRRNMRIELSRLTRKLEEVRGLQGRNDVPLRKLREKVGWSQQQVACFSALPRGTVDYLERGGYSGKERARLDSQIRNGIAAHISEAAQSLSQVGDLLGLAFLRVRRVESKTNSGYLSTNWVYDITVEPYNNFVSAGVILHNSVTVAKGGIYATLNARTAILAATNPVLGKYNPYQNLLENIPKMPIPLLTRFDLIFVIKDNPTPAEDEKLAQHILEVHRKMGYDVPPPIEFKLLRKYIAYVKKRTVALTREAQERLKEYYLDLRRRGGEGSIGATPRTLESLIRLATARAKVLLKDQVTEDDALAAVALMNKMVEDVLTDTATKTKADFGVLIGRPAGERSKLTTALEVMKALEGPDKKPVDRKLFRDELVKSGKFADEDADKMIRTMSKEGIIYESKPGFFRRVGA